MEDYRATGAMLGLPLFLALKPEALYLAGSIPRIPEALEAIQEAKALAEEIHLRCLEELHRLRGVSLAGVGADEPQLRLRFAAAIRIAKEQKSISAQKIAESTYAEYRRQKAS